VCFDTTEAANYVLQKYSTNVQNTCKLMCHAVGDKLADCFGQQMPVDQNRDTSFSAFEDEDD